MDNESKSMNDFNKEPKPIGPNVYDKLTSEQEEQMRELLARNPNMERSEALKIVLGSLEEGDKE